ncbi:MAG TPA: hypothetical protein VHT05_09725 [Candidatus Elarobacter sp.]|jgi:hypothetical protein|nr:hypothetical protein [Candidatus Elarobacter sp.]
MNVPDLFRNRVTGNVEVMRTLALLLEQELFAISLPTRDDDGFPYADFFSTAGPVFRFSAEDIDGDYMEPGATCIHTSLAFAVLEEKPGWGARTDLGGVVERVDYVVADEWHADGSVVSGKVGAAGPGTPASRVACGAVLHLKRRKLFGTNRRRVLVRTCRAHGHVDVATDAAAIDAFVDAYTIGATVPDGSTR